MSIIKLTAVFTLAIFFLPVAMSGEKQKRKAEIVLEGHKSSIAAIAISPTEKWAASVEAGSVLVQPEMEFSKVRVSG